MRALKTFVGGFGDLLPTAQAFIASCHRREEF